MRSPISERRRYKFERRDAVQILAVVGHLNGVLRMGSVPIC